MNKYMRMAINEAKKGIKEGHGGPFGAVIVKDNKVVAKGHNLVLKTNDPTNHGEMMAIHKACKKLQTYDLSGCEIYTTGEPCPMCMAAILWANIDKVYYGCSISDNEDIGFRDKKFDEMFGGGRGSFADYLEETDREACLELFDEYKSMDSTKY